MGPVAMSNGRGRVSEKKQKGRSEACKTSVAFLFNNNVKMQHSSEVVFVAFSTLSQI